MAKLVINSYEEFASHLGEKLGEYSVINGYFAANAGRFEGMIKGCSITGILSFYI